jgi:hypothetical protein
MTKMPRKKWNKFKINIINNKKEIFWLTQKLKKDF